MISHPELYSMGIIDQGNKAAYNELVKLVEDMVKEKLMNKPTFADLKLSIKELAGLYIYRRTKSKPIIIPVIMSKN